MALAYPQGRFPNEGIDWLQLLPMIRPAIVAVFPRRDGHSGR